MSTDHDYPDLATVDLALGRSRMRQTLARGRGDERSDAIESAVQDRLLERRGELVRQRAARGVA